MWNSFVDFWRLPGMAHGVYGVWRVTTKNLGQNTARQILLQAGIYAGA